MDEKAILEADDQFLAALNAMFTGNLAPMEALWSHAGDVIYMGPSGEVLVGWEAVLPDWQKQAKLKLGGEVHFVSRHVTAGPELAVTYHKAEGHNTDADGARVKVSSRGTNVFRKEDGRWKLIAHHSDPLSFLQF